INTVNQAASVRKLALAAIAAGNSLDAQVAHNGTAAHAESLASVLAAGRMLAPLDHDDAHRCLITGTGLTHTGSADTRDSMHAEAAEEEEDEHITDSMQIFRRGLQNGQPPAGEPGVQPEWFYKGDGNIVV